MRPCLQRKEREKIKFMLPSSYRKSLVCSAEEQRCCWCVDRRSCSLRLPMVVPLWKDNAMRASCYESRQSQCRLHSRENEETLIVHIGFCLRKTSDRSLWPYEQQYFAMSVLKFMYCLIIPHYNLRWIKAMYLYV